MAHSSSRFSFLLKASQAVLLAVAVCFSVGAGNSSERFNDLSHRMMCTCGCNEVLGECNHVGCPDSPHLRKELSEAINSGASDDEILAWIAPFAVFAAALLGTILLVKHWSARRVATALSTDPATAPAIAALREKIRRETDPDNDGGN
jgi:cytochrome c-type biogenesis protein CcmH